MTKVTTKALTTYVSYTQVLSLTQAVNLPNYYSPSSDFEPPKFCLDSYNKSSSGDEIPKRDQSINQSVNF